MSTTSITIADVRQITGIDISLIDDTIMQDIIDRVCDQTNQFFNIKTEPTNIIDFINVRDIFQVSVKKSPLLSLRSVKQNNTNIELNNVQFNSMGTIRRDHRLYSNRNLFNRMNNMVYIDYYYGWVEEADDKESLAGSLAAGTDVDITVTNSADYTVDDWIRIKGFDGNQEVAQVKSFPDGTTIRVAELVMTHEADSLIEKLIVPKIVDQFILYESGVNAAINAVGGTYTFNTSYTIEGVSTVKGVPYPHFEKVTNSLTKQRDILKKRIEASLIRVF